MSEVKRHAFMCGDMGLEIHTNPRFEGPNIYVLASDYDASKALLREAREALKQASQDFRERGFFHCSYACDAALSATDEKGEG